MWGPERWTSSRAPARAQERLSGRSVGNGRGGPLRGGNPRCGASTGPVASGEYRGRGRSGRDPRSDGAGRADVPRIDRRRGDPRAPGGKGPAGRRGAAGQGFRLADREDGPGAAGEDGPRLRLVDFRVWSYRGVRGKYADTSDRGQLEDAHDGG